MDHPIAGPSCTMSPCRWCELPTISDPSRRVHCNCMHSIADGNSEVNDLDDGPGSMEAICFGNAHWGGAFVLLHRHSPSHVHAPPLLLTRAH